MTAPREERDCRAHREDDDARRHVAIIAGVAPAQEIEMTDEIEIVSTVERMTSAFAAGDVDAILSTYAPGAVVVGEPGRPVVGEAGLRAMFVAFIESGAAFTYGAHEVVVAGDTGLHLMKWTAPGQDGGEVSALSVAVLRRQPDGGWKMVIDHPFGDSVMRLQPRAATAPSCLRRPT